MHSLLFRTNSPHVAGREGSQSPTFTARVERTWPHHNQHPRWEHYWEGFWWVPTLGPDTVLEKCTNGPPAGLKGDGKGFRSIMGPHWRILGELVPQRRKVLLKEKKKTTCTCISMEIAVSIYDAGLPGSGLNSSMNEPGPLGMFCLPLCLLSWLFKKDNLLDNPFK